MIDAGVASQVAQSAYPVASSGASGCAVAGIAGAIAATISALFAFLNWCNGRRANKISASAAWKTKLMGYVIDEVAGISDEHKLAMQIVKVEHESKESKWSMVKNLTRLRDESQKRVYMIESLAPESQLTKARDAIDESDDSFITNEDLNLPGDKALSRCKLYEEKYDGYTRRLNEFARSLNR